MTRVRPLLAAAFVALVLTGCDRTESGRTAWAEGDPERAYRLFVEARTEAGDDASAELRYDHALAALATGRWVEAEREASALASLGPPIEGRAADLRGHAAWTRSLAAEAEASRPGGDPTAHEASVLAAEDAFLAWRRAAASRRDWPEARRNAERARLRVKALRERRRTGPSRPLPVPGPGGTGEEDGPPLPPPPDDTTPPDDATPPGDDEGPPGAPPGLTTTQLPPSEIRRLLDILVVKEAERRQARRKVRGARSASVEKDW